MLSVSAAEPLSAQPAVLCTHAPHSILASSAAEPFSAQPVFCTTHDRHRILTGSAAKSLSNQSVFCTTHAPHRMLAGSTAGPRYAACTLVAGALDFSALELFEAQRAHMWQRLAGSALAGQGPSLFTYSWDDAIADPIRAPACLHAAAAMALSLASSVTFQTSFFQGHSDVPTAPCWSKAAISKDAVSGLARRMKSHRSGVPWLLVGLPLTTACTLENE
eukprot:1147127-Pelagomonas_calceolata.AAC.3